MEIPGEWLYFDVLFPTVGRQGPAVWLKEQQAINDLHASEASIALDICTALWAERQRATLTPNPPPERVLSVSINDPVVGKVTAGVCFQCPWVAWDRAIYADDDSWDYEAEHGECLLAGEHQVADRGASGKAPTMRITPSAADLGLGDHGPYYDALTRRTLMRQGYGLVGRTNHGARDAAELWRQRERLREEAASGRRASSHRGVVLTTVAESLIEGEWTDVMFGHAACLSCTWIQAVASSRNVCDWYGATLDRARRHERGAADYSDEETG